MKLETPSSLMCSRFIYLLFLSFLENSLILPVVCRVILYSLYLTFNLFI